VQDGGKFNVLDTAQLKQHQLDAIKSVTTVLSLNDEAAARMLRAYRWYS
jgi:hypothetical protein